MRNRSPKSPSLRLSLLPIILLLCSMVAIILSKGAFAVQEFGQWLLLLSGLVAATLAMTFCRCSVKDLADGLQKAAKQVLPSIPILLLIGTVSATWMLSGVVPVMIDFGLKVLSPGFFLTVACAVCALISVLCGSSWTTIATIGVAFMGIGTVMGYSPGWIAGAIISGAYFGDKISPLSDTTVLASSSCGVNLFQHIRNMMLTTVPAILIALTVFMIAGFFGEHPEPAGHDELITGLRSAFNLSPWLMAVPLLTGILIFKRVNSYATLTISSLLGLAAMYIFQPAVISSLTGSDDASLADNVFAGLTALLTSTQIETESELLDSLVGTGGMKGMLPTVYLVTCATVFGGIMIGSGMLATITEALRRHIRSPRSSVTATVSSGIGLNAFTGDQFLSIIISANIYKEMYRHNSLDPLLLSRTVEDSVSVTSVLIPWNSCGLTQATVLGVPTLTYLPYCIFNILSPIISLATAWAAIGIRRLAPASK